ncbi:magnesium transporter [Rhodococcus sp. NPDC054953]
MGVTDGTVLTVVLGPGGPVRGVREVLTDLSAAGLVSAFVWVDDSGVSAHAARVSAYEIDGGVTRAVQLQDLLAARRVDRVRVCVLVPCAEGTTPVTAETERAVAELVSSNSGGADVVRLRLLLLRPGDRRSGSAVMTRAGWHNLLIAPEESRGPGMGHLSLRATDDSTAVGRHAAPVVAGVAGLWADVAHAPFDGDPVLPGNALRVVRTFYRRLDTADVEHRLRREVLDFGGQLPLPRDAGTSVVYVEDAASAAHTMAQAVWGRHRHLFRGPRVAAPAAPEQQPLGFGAALTMFFSFLWAVLRNAPTELFARAAHSVAASTATVADRALLGAVPGAYKIVVNGVGADGSRVGWGDYEAATRTIADTLDTAASGQRPDSQAGAADLSAVWRDYVRGGLTLADASERSADLPPAQVGAHRAIVRSASDVAPGPGDTFTDLAGIVSATLNVQAIDPVDLLALDDVRLQLRDLEQDPALGVEARRAGTALAGWWDRMRGSYAAGFGGILVRGLTDTRAEVRVLAERIEAAVTRTDVDEITAARHRRLVRLAQLSFLVLLAVAVTAGVLSWLDVTSWWIGGSVIAAGVLAWSGFLAREFMIERHGVARLVAEREAATRALDADRANLRVALRDVQRLSMAYRQYLSWSRALGAFLGKPLGDSDEAAPTRRWIEWGLPRGTVLGAARPDAGQVTRLAEQLRHDLLTVGWLTEPWDDLCGAAGDRLGAAAQDVRRNPELLASKAGAGSGSALDEWSVRLGRGEITATDADVLWRRAQDGLDLVNDQRVRQVLDAVDADDHTRGVRISLDEFLAGVGTSVDKGFFDRGVFTDVATTKGLTAVVGDRSTVARVGLGMVAVTTQFGEGISDEDLISGEADRGPEPVVPVAPAFDIRPAQRTGDVLTAPVVHRAPVVDGIEF